MADTACVIGEGIQIKGNLSGSGDLVICGRVEGQINLQDHLTVESTGMVVADVSTRGITISGTMSGNVDASEAVVISAQATVQGDITTNDLQIAEGASLHGRLIMDLDLPEGIL
ncbi:MAG: polymer-forming cytoskeletal protein [Deltaproteobacteria bacterium]|nr:MAG: polymer-forming cytoskeletal protein [Deltaproteobacteria bacterium]